MTKTKISLAAFVVLLFIWLLSGPQTNSFRIKLIDSIKLPLKFSYQISQNLKYLNPFYHFKISRIKLQNKIISLNKELYELREVYNENSRLKTLLGFKNSYIPQGIPAEVIAKDPTNPTALIIIDKGSDHGIKEDMCVVSIYGLVGRIYEVSKHAAKVLLITDPDSRLGAFVQRSREQGLLVGLNKRLCRLVYLESDADVKKGDLIFTSGLTGIFPKNIFIGEVIGTGMDLNNLYKYADIRPYSRLSTLEEVICIR